MQTKFIGDFRRIHGIGKILLISKDQEKGVPKLVFVKHTLEFFTCLRDTFSVVGVDNEDDTLSILKICKMGLSEVASGL